VLTAASFFAVVAALAIIGWQYRSIPASSNMKTMAVLQLRPLAGGVTESDRALGMGLTDAIATRIGASRNVIVRPVSITETGDPLETGRMSQVDGVLDGTFQRDGDRIRISMRLLQVSDGRQIWSGTFNESEKDIFKLQDALSEQAAGALAINLNQQQREMILKRYTANVEAYQAYLRGRYLYSNGDARIEDYDRAVVEFDRSLKLDPNYALAYTGLADAYARKGNNSAGNDRRDFYEKAKANAIKALALDDDLSEAHLAKGWIDRIYDWNWAESEKHFTRAIELAPNESRNYHLYAFLLITLGRTAEGVEKAKRAMELDPVRKASVYAYALSCDRRFDESIAEYNKILGVSPDVTVWRGLVEAYVSAGKPAEALAVYERAPKAQQDEFAIQVYLPIAYSRLGDRSRSDEMLQDLERRSTERPERSVRLAITYAGIGRNGDAFNALERALAIRDDRLMWIKTNPTFDPLRNDPRYMEILRKMGLDG
jgi:serine/threonine-protein kinase